MLAGTTALLPGCHCSRGWRREEAAGDGVRRQDRKRTASRAVVSCLWAGGWAPRQAHACCAEAQKHAAAPPATLHAGGSGRRRQRRRRPRTGRRGRASCACASAAATSQTPRCSLTPRGCRRRCHLTSRQSPPRRRHRDADAPAAAACCGAGAGPAGGAASQRGAALGGGQPRRRPRRRPGPHNAHSQRRPQLPSFVCMAFATAARPSPQRLCRTQQSAQVTRGGERCKEPSGPGECSP